MNEFPKTKETIDVTFWLSVKDNPIQRNTELHAKKARNNHLKNFAVTQKNVAAAVLPNGAMYKIDGHTRAFLWQEGSLKKPDTLDLDLYHVENIDEIEYLYKLYDSPHAAETATDRLFGAFNKHSFYPNSSLIKTGGTTSAITILENPRTLKVDIYNAVEPWIDSLKIIDELHLSPAKFTSGVLAACLITMKIYKEESITFWTAYNNDAGMKNESGRDGVQALTELVNLLRASKKLTGWGNVKDVCGKALSCYEKYAANQQYIGGVKWTNIYQYIEKIKKMPK